MLRPVGSPVTWLVSRIEKLEHYQTVLYEIDMLRFAHERMISPWDGASEGDVWVYLESFLVHYRNLLEFFGKNSPRKDDLTILRPEVSLPAGACPDEADLRHMRQMGEHLWNKYEDTNRRDTISRYLQHCTRFRTVAKEWHPYQMMSEISELLELFEKHLPRFKPATDSH